MRSGLSEGAGWRQAARSLRSRNYRLFFAGQGISLIGTWMQQIAMSWLVYRLTGSALLLGVVGFASQLPAFLVAPFAGVVADRFNRHRILVGTQTLAMIQALALGILTTTHHIQVWHIVGLGIFLGLVNAVDMPTRQAFVVQMVERKEDLGNAIALNSSLFNSARLIGPSVAGALLPLIGEGPCFLLNSASYLAVIIALLAMRVAPRKVETETTPVLRRMREGFAYVAGFTPIRDILLLLGAISLMGMPYTVLMPVFAKEILHGDARTLGLIMSANGLGALAGALALASRRSVLGLGRQIAVAASVFGTGLCFFSLARTLWLALPLMVVVGAGGILQMASSNTIIQTLVDEDKRGRVMSLYMMSFVGTAPFGSLLAGAIGEHQGVPFAIRLSGGLSILAALLFARRLPEIRRVARPVYVRLGILPAEE